MASDERTASAVVLLSRSCSRRSLGSGRPTSNRLNRVKGRSPSPSSWDGLGGLAGGSSRVASAGAAAGACVDMPNDCVAPTLAEHLRHLFTDFLSLGASGPENGVR